jgi:hypothetical protein
MPGWWRWFVSLADKYSAESGIPAELYYTLFRAGVPTDADGMYRTDQFRESKEHLGKSGGNVWERDKHNLLQKKMWMCM